MLELYVPRSNDQLHEHAHECLCLNLVLDGALYERVEGTLHHLPSGSLSVLPGAVPHAVHVAGRNAQVLHMEYDAGYVARFPALQRPMAYLNWLDASTRSLAERARDALLRADACSRVLLEALALEALALAVRHSLALASSAGSEPIPAHLQALAALWRQEPGRPLHLARIAAELGLSPAALSRQFRRHYGMRLSDYVLGQRIDAACRLLAGSGHSLTQIASTLGFADQSHFCRSFQRALGMPPSAYRRTVPGMAVSPQA